MEKTTFGECEMRTFLKLILFLGILFGISGAFILYSSWPLIFGETIALETRPVDPFDILRGQYIVINYKISTIPLLKDAQLGDNVYVLVQENENKIFDYSSASFVRPSQGRFIKGIVRNIANDKINIEYGIEQYFFERNAEFEMSNLTVSVKVSSSGRAKISELLQNGKPIVMKYQKMGLTS
ncbi:GDYXXLXY domain-containing protein [Candidatus Woesearchaeota archaeon]|nr:GDYXXLXY domain-containing protein [Candidatus Woesearchaeota archaeon]